MSDDWPYQGFEENPLEKSVSSSPGILRQLSLVKGEERFVFRYSPGQESEVLDAFASLAKSPDSEFDWFDAAVLSYNMGRRLESEQNSLP